MCQKKPKDGKSHCGATIFLEVLLNDEEVTMQQLNKLCKNENVFSYTRILRRRMHVEKAPSGTMQNLEFVGEGTKINREIWSG